MSDDLQLQSKNESNSAASKPTSNVSSGDLDKGSLSDPLSSSYSAPAHTGGGGGSLPPDAPSSSNSSGLDLSKFHMDPETMLDQGPKTQKTLDGVLAAGDAHAAAGTSTEKKKAILAGVEDVSGKASGQLSDLGLDSSAKGLAGAGDLAKAGSSAVDAAAVLTDAKASKTDKAKALGTALKDGSAPAADGLNKLLDIAGASDGTKEAVTTSGSMLSNSGEAAIGVANAVDAYKKEGASTKDKRLAMADGAQAIATSGTKAVADGMKLFGEGELGQTVAGVGAGASDVIGGSKSSIEFLDTLQGDGTKREKVDAGLNAAKDLGTTSAAGAGKIAAALGDEELGKKIAESGVAVSHLGDAGLAGSEAYADFHKEGASKVDKTNAVLKGSGAAGESVGKATANILNVVGQGEHSEKATLSGAAVKDLSTAGLAGTEAYEAFTKEGATTVDKTNAVLTGSGKAGTSLGSATANILKVAGQGEHAEKATLSGSAVNNLTKAGLVGTEAYTAFNKEGATKSDKANALLDGSGGISNNIGQATSDILKIAGQDGHAEKAAMSGAALADASSAGKNVVDIVDAYNDTESSKADRTRAALKGLDGLATNAGNASLKGATVAGDAELGGKIQKGSTVVNDLAQGGQGAVDIVEAFNATEGTKAERTAKGLKGADTLATKFGNGAKTVAEMSGNEGVGNKIGVGSGVASDVTKMGLSVAENYDALTDKNAKTSDRARAGLKMSESFTKSAGNATEKVATLMGKEDQGKNINTVVQSSAGVLAAGNSAVDAYDAIYNKDLKTHQKVSKVANATKDVGNAGLDVFKATQQISKNDDNIKSATAAQGTLTSAASAVGSGAEFYGALQDPEKSTMDKARLGAKAGQDAIATGTSAAKTYATITKDNKLTENITKFDGATGSAFKAVNSGFNLADNVKNVREGWKNGDVTKVGLEGTKAVGNTASIVQHGAKAVEVLSTGKTAAMAGQVSGVASQVGAGVLGAGSAVANGIATGKDAKMAYELRDDSEIGKATIGQLNKSKASLATKWGIDTEADGWQKTFDSKYADKYKQAQSSEDAFKAFSEDTDVAGFHDAKQIDDARKYMRNRKIGGAAVKGLDTAGDVVSTVGTYTAGADGGATKAVGMGMKVGAMGIRAGDSAYDRAQRTSAVVEAEDAMKGYNKQGFIGKQIDKLDAATQPARQAIADGASYAYGKGKDAANFIGDKATQGADWVKSKATAVGDWVGDKASAAGDWVSDKATKAKDAFVNSKVGQGLISAGNTAAEYGGKAVDYMSDKASQAKDYATEKYGQAKEYLGGKVNQAKDYASEKYGQAKDWATGKYESAKGYATDKFNSAKDYASEKYGQAKDWASEKAAVVSGKVDAAKDWASDKAGQAKDYLSEKAESASSWFSGHFNKASEATGSLFGSAMDWMSSKADAASSWVGDKASKAKDAVMASPVGDAIKYGSNKVSQATDYVGEKVNKASDFVGEKVSAATAYASEKASAAKDYVGGKVNQAKDYASEKYGQAKDYVGGKVDKAKAYASEKYGKAKDYVGGKVDTAKAYASEKYGQAKDYVGGKVDKAKAYASEKYGKAKDYVGGKVDTAKAYASEKYGQAKDWAGKKAEKVGGWFSSAGSWLSDKASKAKDAVVNSSAGQAVSNAGKYVANKANDAKEWTRENIWETSDMKWARKVGKFFTPQSSDKMLESTREKWADNKQANDLKESDYAAYQEIQKGLSGNKKDQHTNNMLKHAKGTDEDDPNAANARKLFQMMNIDHEDENAGAQMQSQLAF